MFSTFPDCVADQWPHGVFALSDPLLGAAGPPGFRLSEGVGVCRSVVALAGIPEDATDRREVAGVVVVAALRPILPGVIDPKFNLLTCCSCRGRPSLSCWIGVMDAPPLQFLLPSTLVLGLLHS